MNNKDRGREAWAGFGLAGLLAVKLDAISDPEQFKWMLIAVVVLSVLSTIQRTIVKFMDWKYNHKE